MMANAVILCWVALIVGEEAGSEGFVRVLQWLVEFFFVNNRLLALRLPDRLQE